MTARQEEPMSTPVNTDTDTIATQLRELLSPSGNAETIASLLEQEDHTAVAEAALALLLRLALAVRATTDQDPEVLLAQGKPPRSSRDKLAERLRQGSPYQGPEASS
jgi:hypothetical protein